MENLYLKITQTTPIELVSYFSVEIFYLFGIILNLIIFFTLRKKLNIKRLSDFITNGVLILNSITLFGILAKNFLSIGQIDFSLFNGLLIFDNKAIFLQFLINIFLLLYSFISYKLTRKANFKTPLINSVLLFCGLISCLITLFQGQWQLYVLLSILSYSIYRYSSSSRIRRDDFFSADFLLINISADILFLAIYLTSFLIKEFAQMTNLQSLIIQVCITCSMLLKLGIFPIYNYSICNKYKSNIPFSILLFSFFPLVGTIAIEKVIQEISAINEIHQITITTFLLATMLICSFNIFKAKNLVKFIANISYCLFSFSIASFLFMEGLGLKLAIFSAFAILGIFSLIEIIKIDLNPEKINISFIRGIFYNNRLFALLFVGFLLILSSAVPSVISKINLEIIKTIYLYDKFGMFFIAGVIFANTLIILSCFKIIQKIFDYHKKTLGFKLTKRTTPNYVVPIVIIIVLFINLFL